MRQSSMVNLPEQPFFTGETAVFACSSRIVHLCFAQSRRHLQGATVTAAGNHATTPILVRKYGGTSIASVDRISAVADDLVACKELDYTGCLDCPVRSHERKGLHLGEA